MLNEQQLDEIIPELFDLLREENAAPPPHLERITELFSTLSAKEKKQLVDAKDQNGNTPLHIAAQKGHFEIAELLIKNDADVNAKENDGNTPLHLSALFGKTAITKLLLQNDANVQARDEEGNVPLHKSTFFNNQTADTELLLQYGTDIHVRDNAGNTPLHVSALFGNTTIAHILLNEGAEVSDRLVDKINQWRAEGHLPDVELASHPENPHVRYNINARVKPWERKELSKESAKQALTFRENFFASSVFGFQIDALPAQTMSPYLAKHLFPLDNQVFSLENIKQLATYTKVCTSWRNSVGQALGGYLKNKIPPEAIARSGLSALSWLPDLGNKEYAIKFQNGFREMVEKQKEENNKSKSPNTIGNN